MDLIPGEAVLAHTLATDFAPATNLKGAVAGAAWRYLLPTLEHQRVVCLGRPPRAALATLAGTADEVVVIGPRGGGPAAASVSFVSAAEAAARIADRPAGSVDLVWIAADAGGLDAAAAAALRDRLTAAASIVSEQATAHDGAPTVTSVLRRDRASATVVVRPDHGEVRSAVAAGDARAAADLRARGLAGPAISVPGPARLARSVGRLADRTLADRRQRRIEVAFADTAALPPHPPAYLVAMAAGAGLDIHDWGCALSATGDYNTQKVLALLSPPEAEGPAIVVKMTRDASVVARLETERDALRSLAALGLADDHRIPSVLFAGRHAGLAMVGETAIDARPFERATAGRAGAQVGTATAEPVADAVAWFTDLAVRSARPAAPADVAAAMADLLARFRALCRPGAATVAGLEDAVAAIASSASPFPVVFQHGDPGTWNLLVHDDGTVAVLDWENADAAGMPLWDLFYLLRSHAVGTGRRSSRFGGLGRMPRLTAVQRLLFDESTLSEFIVSSIHGYAGRIGLAKTLVEPLFHLCWMHQALKEATRVAPGRVASAHYNRLLTAGLERRTAPTLRRLFEAAR